MHHLLQRLDAYKLPLSFALIISLLLITGLFGLNSNNRLTSLLTRMHDHPMTVIQASLSAEREILALHRDMKDVALFDQRHQIQALAEQSLEREKRVTQYLSQVQQRILGEKGKALTRDVTQLFQDWSPIRARVINASLAGDTQSAVQITQQEGAAHVQKLLTSSQKLSDYAKTMAGNFYHQAQNTAQISNRKMLVTLVVALVIGSLVAFRLYRSIIQRMRDFKQTIVDIEASSDLTRRLKITSQDDIGQADRAFNAMLDAIEGLVIKVNQSINQLTEATRTLTQNSAAASRSAVSQSEQLEQMAAAMNQMSATVQEVANAAAQASESAEDADKAVTRGRGSIDDNIAVLHQLAEKIRHSAQAVSELDGESQAIVKVIDVIREIADQTNLLALNAAIEAARAGEQGRGFAVVADEVRSLASRTHSSTFEIDDMVKKLSAGSKASSQSMEAVQHQAGETANSVQTSAEIFTRISDHVAQMADLNRHIATAAEQQSATAEQLNQNVNKIREDADLGAQSAQESEATSQALSDLAQTLSVQANQFKVSHQS